MQKYYKIHDKSSRNLYNKHGSLFDGLLGHAQKVLNYDRPVVIYLLDDEKNSEKSLGKTGYYNPDDDSIGIYATNRHIKDILRSLAHELVHHKQNCDGKFDHITDTKLGYAQEDESLRGSEEEAYKLGNLKVFRDFEDNHKRENPTMQERRLRTLNEKTTKKLLGKLVLKEQAFSRAKKRWRDAEADEADDDDDWSTAETVGATGGVGVGAGVIVQFYTWATRNKETADGVIAVLRRILAEHPELVKDAETWIRAGVAEGADVAAVKPSRWKRVKNTWKLLMESEVVLTVKGKTYAAGEYILRALHKFVSSRVLQSKYFGGTWLTRGPAAAIEWAIRRGTAGRATLADGIARTPDEIFEKITRKIAERTVAYNKAREGATAAAREILKANKGEIADAVTKSATELQKVGKAETAVAEARQALKAMEAANKAKPMSVGTMKIDKAKQTLKAAEDALKAAQKGHRAAEAAVQGLASSPVRKAAEAFIEDVALPAAEREAIAAEVASEAIAAETTGIAARRAEVVMMKQGIGKGVAYAGTAIKAARVSRGIGAAAVLTARITVGAALNIWLAWDLGRLAGEFFNWLMSETEMEKQKERIEKARSNVNYAMAEMEAYCKGTGSLCRNVGAKAGETAKGDKWSRLQRAMEKTSEISPGGKGGYKLGKEIICSGRPGGYLYDVIDPDPERKWGIPGLRGAPKVPGYSALEVEKIVDDYYNALEGGGTKEAKLTILTNELTGKPQLAKAVEWRFYYKYSLGPNPFDPDGLRDAIEDDLAWWSTPTENEAVAPFEAWSKTDKVLEQRSVWQRWISDSKVDKGGRVYTNDVIEQQAGVYHPKDLAVILGCMISIAEADRKDGKLVTTKDPKTKKIAKIELMSGAKLKKFEACYNAIFNGEGQLFGLHHKDDWFRFVKGNKEALDALVVLQMAYGKASFEIGGEKVTEDTAEAIRLAEMYHDALDDSLWGGTNNTMIDELTQKLTGNPELAAAVERSFNKKYGPEGSGDLRQWLKDDYFWEKDRKRVLAPFVAADIAGIGGSGELGKIGGAGAGAPAGPVACRGGLPAEPGCQGAVVGVLYRILYEAVPGYDKEIDKTDLKKTDYDQKLVDLITKFQNDEGIAPTNGKIKDFDATDKALTKYLNAWRRDEGIEGVFSESRLYKLNQKLMEQFK